MDDARRKIESEVSHLKDNLSGGKDQHLTSDQVLRLQGHVPETLKELYIHPHKLPFLMQFLEDKVNEKEHAQQKLLFLLEVEQQRLVPHEVKAPSLRRIVAKYLSPDPGRAHVTRGLQLEPEVLQELQAHIKSQLSASHIRHHQQQQHQRQQPHYEEQQETALLSELFERVATKVELQLSRGPFQQFLTSQH